MWQKNTDRYRERQSSKSLQKPYFHVFLINLHSTQYMYLHTIYLHHISAHYIYSVCLRRFRVIFVQVLPCISLVILNILLFSAMRRAEQRRRRLTINRCWGAQYVQYVISNTSEPTTTQRRGATRSAAPSWAGRLYILTVASLSNTP